MAEAASATEALAMVIQEKKLSNKINYKVLDNLKAIHTSSSSSFLVGGSTDSTGLGLDAATASSAKSILKVEPMLNRWAVAAFLCVPPDCLFHCLTSS